jgi:SAM-dependent methyltransferase
MLVFLQATPAKTVVAEVNSVIPPSFSAEIYSQLNPDLSNLSPTELKSHWAIFGINEGRRAYPFVDRQGFSSFFPESKSVLEISPFTAPFFVGENVSYADVLGTAALRERARELGLEAGSIQEIDYVVEPADMSKAIDRKFDLVSSSHVIEHQPNLLGHLRQVGELLNDSGLYVVVLPDKRYCFDHFIPESIISELIDADISSRTRHTLKSVIDHVALTTHNEPVRHWNNDHGEFRIKPEKVAKALEEFKTSAGSYVDVHSFYFTPNSFEQLIRDTNMLGLQPFKLHTIYPTYRNNLEFYAVLELSK